MSYKQRERKRRKRIAIAAAQRDAGGSRDWWLTLVTRDCGCARCAGVLRAGREMVYRHTPREALCCSSAQDDHAITAKPSVRWQQSRVRAHGLAPGQGREPAGVARQGPPPVSS